MREGLRRSRRQEAEETVVGAVVQIVGYAVLTGAVVLLLMGISTG